MTATTHTALWTLWTVMSQMNDKQVSNMSSVTESTAVWDQVSCFVAPQAQCRLSCNYVVSSEVGVGAASAV